LQGWVKFKLIPVNLIKQEVFYPVLYH